MRTSVSATLGWDQEQYRDFFHEQLYFGDPALWQGNYRPQNTLIIESSKDDCIPGDSRASLVQATGEPERIVYPYNHWQPFLAMTPGSLLIDFRLAIISSLPIDRALLLSQSMVRASRPFFALQKSRASTATPPGTWTTLSTPGMEVAAESS